jgi:hypothetical protein
LPNQKTGKIHQKKFYYLKVKVMAMSNTVGTLSLNYKMDYDTGAGQTVNKTITSTTNYSVTEYKFDVGGSGKIIQLSLSDSLSSGGYGIVAMLLCYEDNLLDD